MGHKTDMERYARPFTSARSGRHRGDGIKVLAVGLRWKAYFWTKSERGRPGRWRYAGSFGNEFDARRAALDAKRASL